MKKIMMVIMAAGVVGLLVIGTALATMASSGNRTGDGGRFQWAKQVWNKLMDRHHTRMQMREKAMENMTEVSGTFSCEDGPYYVDGQVVSFGPEWFIENVTARSDYDRDGTYETIKEELKGLNGTKVTVIGIMKNDGIIAFYINGIWYRNPVRMPHEISEITGILEHDGNSYAIKNQTIFFGPTDKLFSKVARSDYDRDGQMESMYYELEGLMETGEEITLDGFYREDVFIPAHINGMWYREMSPCL
ncbi:MAG: hypothetical protein U9O96_07375 [Candidatus Thermoplasmatota archaeon]|nr:hypothetical protein [Candidatus Thermoplasmatota archaeon]